jgi:hypothetical protein
MITRNKRKYKKQKSSKCLLLLGKNSRGLYKKNLQSKRSRSNSGRGRVLKFILTSPLLLPALVFFLERIFCDHACKVLVFKTTAATGSRE